MEYSPSGEDRPPGIEPLSSRTVREDDSLQDEPPPEDTLLRRLPEANPPGGPSGRTSQADAVFRSGSRAPVRWRRGEVYGAPGT